MACFIVPGAEAVVTSIVTKVIENKEKKADEIKLSNGATVSEINKEHFSKKLKRLNNLLFGGSALLAFEHVWHGEVSLFAPFITAAKNPADFSKMLHEMSTVGVTMSLLVTFVWGVWTYMDMKAEASESAAKNNFSENK